MTPVDAVIMAIGTMGEPDTPEATLSTNLVGPALLILSSQQLLANQGSGTLIVLSSSAAAAGPREEILNYAIAKQGIDTLVGTTTASMKSPRCQERAGQARIRFDGNDRAPAATSTGINTLGNRPAGGPGPETSKRRRLGTQGHALVWGGGTWRNT